MLLSYAFRFASTRSEKGMSDKPRSAWFVAHAFFIIRLEPELSS